MGSVGQRCLARVIVCLLTAGAVPGWAFAQTPATVGGVITDPLGAAVPGADVTLIDERGRVAGTRTTDGEGAFGFEPVPPGRYGIRATAAGFVPFASTAAYVGPGGRLTLEGVLQISPVQQSVVVTAAAEAVPQSRTGAPVTVIDRPTIESLEKTDLLEALRLVPGAQVLQTGGRGGATRISLRGGNSSFTKALVDGVAVNDIGGLFDLAHLQVAGVEQAEVMRQANSVLYGSDALTGVIGITTRRGRTRLPELTVTASGGSLGTVANGVSGGGAAGRVDYFAEYAFLDTDNHVPNNAYRNHSFASRLGVAVGGTTDVSLTLRHVDTRYGSPNGFGLYGIADDSIDRRALTFGSVSAQSQWTDRWQSTVRFGFTDQTLDIVNPTPTGEAVDPFGFGANYVGRQVTLRGANGYTTTGRAILDFGGAYPSVFDSRETRRVLSGQATYQVSPAVSVSSGARLEREHAFGDPDADPTLTRTNRGAFVEVRGGLANRAYVTAGLGYEYNGAFESAVTPRLSLAVYARPPRAGAAGDTKITFNAGKGIKSASVFQQENSLHALLQLQPPGTRLAADPIGPERSLSVDVGVEQGFADGRVRVRATYFWNRFEDLIEFVGDTVLPQVGIPVEIAEAVEFGAFVNSSSFDAQGLETSAEAFLGTAVRVSASYTFLDAEVTESFASSALAPAINPSIPGVPIGAFSPLVGQRPFGRATHSGWVLASYGRGPAQVTLSAFFAGKKNSSTFLSDEFFGNSMLLPNEDLEAAYQKVDLGASYRVHPRVKAFVSVENLLDREYDAAFGFPSLPRTGRVGLAVALGGDGTP